MKNHIPVFFLSLLILLILLLMSCGGQDTPTTSPTSAILPPSTSPSSTTPSPSATETQTPSMTPTPTPSETAEPSPTTTENPFRGTMSGTWIEETPLAIKLHGTFSLVIDESGVVTGTFIGDYVGTISGLVDLEGNLDAVGIATLGGIQVDLTWQGRFYLSGTTLTTEGTWTGPLSNGTFAGTGTTS